MTAALQVHVPSDYVVIMLHHTIMPFWHYSHCLAEILRTVARARIPIRVCVYLVRNSTEHLLVRLQSDCGLLKVHGSHKSSAITYWLNQKVHALPDTADCKSVHYILSLHVVMSLAWQFSVVMRLPWHHHVVMTLVWHHVVTTLAWHCRVVWHYHVTRLTAPYSSSYLVVVIIMLSSH